MVAILLKANRETLSAHPFLFSLSKRYRNKKLCVDDRKRCAPSNKQKPFNKRGRRDDV